MKSRNLLVPFLFLFVVGLVYFTGCSKEKVDATGKSSEQVYNENLEKQNKELAAKVDALEKKSNEKSTPQQNQNTGDQSNVQQNDLLKGAGNKPLNLGTVYSVAEMSALSWMNGDTLFVKHQVIEETMQGGYDGKAVYASGGETQAKGGLSGNGWLNQLRMAMKGTPPAKWEMHRNGNVWWCVLPEKVQVNLCQVDLDADNNVIALRYCDIHRYEGASWLYNNSAGPNGRVAFKFPGMEEEKVAGKPATYVGIKR